MERWREELYYNSLMHYGIPGMRKGRRRFTNADGTLNAAGERRYLDGGGNAVSTSTRQRGSLEGANRERLVGMPARGMHAQRVADVAPQNRPESRQKVVTNDGNVHPVTKREPLANSTPNSNKTQPVKSYNKNNRPPSRPKNISEDTTVKDVEKREPVHGYGHGVSGQTQAEYQEKKRQEQLARAERERAAVGKTANPAKAQDKKNSGNNKKKKTVDDFKKKGERYVAKKTR